MHLFRSVTPAIAREAFMASATDMERSLEQDRNQRAHALRRYRIAYKGGAEAVEMLLRRWNETPADWVSRQGHYRNVPIMREAVNKLAWLVYGKSPSREVWVGDRPPSVIAEIASETPSEPDAVTNELSAWVTMTLEENRDALLCQRAMRQRIRDGIAVVKLWGVDATGTPSLPFESVRMDIHAAEDAWPIYDPDDPDVMLALAEYRRGRWYLWTADEVIEVNPDMTYKAEVGDHPIPGVIPFAVLGDGCPMLADALEYQKCLINRHSVGYAIERAYAYPVGVMSGTPQNQQVTPIGLPGQPAAIDVGGGSRYLHFVDPAGGFSWVSADAPVDQLRESYKAELTEALELGCGLPADAGGVEGVGPEQPTTIALRWIRAFINRDQYILEAQAYEDARMHVLGAYGAEYSADLGLPGYDVDAMDWEINFPQNPLPHDARAEREGDRAEVVADLRPEADYVKRHVFPNATADELRQVLSLLEKQKATTLGGVGGPPPAPDFGEEDIEP